MSRTRINILIAALLMASGPTARAQFSSGHKPACSDGVDNDQDGHTDFPDDPGCDGPNDDDEGDLSYPLDKRARIIVLFDTSGSMTWDVCGDGLNHYPGGDGSAECPGHDEPKSNNMCPLRLECGQTDGCPACNTASSGNGLTDDTRIYKVKKGLSDAIKAFGEINWALYRFYQEPNDFVQTVRADNTIDCAASPCNGNIGKDAFAGWHGSLRDDCTPARFIAGQQLVRFGTENQYTLLQWMDNTSNWSGGLPPSGYDIELRGSGHTPLGASLQTIENDLPGIKGGDPIGDCRPYAIVVVTDGQNNCNPDPVGVASDIWNNGAGVPVYVIGFASAAFLADDDAIAQAGGTNQAFPADSPDSLSAALAQIVSKTVKVELCNGLDDDCDHVPDNGFNVGQPCDNGQTGECFRNGVFVCDDNGLGTHCSAPHVDPGTEVCNGKDDNCNGLIDEGLQCPVCGQEVCNGLDDDCNGKIDDGPMPGVGDPCGIDLGVCKPGTLQCQGGKLVCVGFTGPSVEICDNKDNNCDGIVDRITRACYDFPTGCEDVDPSPNNAQYMCKGNCRAGLQTCLAGAFGACAGEVGPKPELCNGQDDNCDGRIDEDFPTLGMPCETGKGLCHTTGHFVCSADGKGVVCDAPVITGVTEVCNGQDDDCDGVIDNLPNPPPPPIGEPCGSCGGHYVCGPNGLACQGGTGSPEVCNGKDDDCNGLVDDGDMPGVGQTCVPGAPDHPLFELKGECKPGVQQCIAGSLTCVNYTGPQPEVCNGKDDNCDGVVDDNALCPSAGDVCYHAECVSPCPGFEKFCRYGYVRKELPEGCFCVPSACVNKQCAPDELCDPTTGECVNPCSTISCPADTTCKQGRCLDCFALGCDSGKICKADDNRIGHCVADPCAGINCQAGEVCVEGTCTATACGGGCKPGEVCDKGRCVAQCSVDICSGAQCADGQVCNPSTGSCIADPCLRANCGDQTCQVACDGSAQCVAHVGVDVLATGGGGLACNVGGGGEPGGWLEGVLLALGLVVMRRPRRRP